MEVYYKLYTRMNKWDKYAMALERGLAKHRRLFPLVNKHVRLKLAKNV